MINQGLLIVTIIPILFLFYITDSPNCQKIRNGKFYYYTKKSREKINIDRYDSLQLETNAETGRDSIKSKIIWIGSCKYEMFINALSDNTLSEVDSLIAATPSYGEIIFIGHRFYICFVKMDIFDKHLEFRDTIFFRR